jgi:hypothetical protein
MMDICCTYARVVPPDPKEKSADLCAGTRRVATRHIVLLLAALRTVTSRRFVVIMAERVALKTIKYLE